MRKILAIALLSIALPGLAHAETAAASTAASQYTTAQTDLGTLLDDPAAKAILTKYAPALVGSEQLSMARGMTLKAIQAYAGDMLSDEVLGKIDADLAKLPAKK